MKILQKIFFAFSLFLAACATKPSIPPETKVAVSPPEDKSARITREGMELLYSKNPEVKNEKEAFAKFSQAAELGNPIAMDHLGGFYAMGIGGLKKDCSKAIGWYEKASSLGYPLAMNNLAFLLVTCHEPNLRDPARAEQIVHDLFKGSPSIVALLDTYAAVLAAGGDFRQAAKTMEVVVDIEKLLDLNQEKIDQAEKTLTLYRKGKPLDSAHSLNH